MKEHLNSKAKKVFGSNWLRSRCARISNKIRYANAGKRGGGKATASLENLAAIAKDPDPSHAVALAEVVSSIGERLDEIGQRVLELRMANLGYGEIAKELSVSERTVGRKLELIKQLLTESLDTGDLEK